MKSLKKNYIYNLIYELLKLLIPFLTIPYVSRVIGADGVGIYSFTYSIVYYYLIVARFGADVYGRREIAYYRDDITERSRVFWEVFLFRVFTSCICIAVYLLHVHFFISENKQIYLILVMVLLDNMADISWFYQGMEEFGFIVRRNLAVKLCGLAYIFIFVKSREDLTVYVFGIVFWQLLGNILLWLHIPKDVVRKGFGKLHVFGHFSEILSLFLPGIAVNVYTVFDKTMIGLMCEGSFENGYYEQAYKTVLIILTVVTALGAVATPRISYYFARKEDDQIRNLMMKSYRAVMCISIPFCFGLIGISGGFVPWFYGPGYEKVADLLRISAFIIIAVGISNITGNQFMVPTKRQSVFTVSILTGAALNFILNLIMIPHLQSVGAIIASAVSEIWIAGVQLFFVRKELSVGGILKNGVRYLISAAVMLAVVMAEGSFLPQTVFGTLCMVITGAAIYAVMLLILKDSMFLDYSGMVINRIRLIIKRNK